MELIKDWRQRRTGLVERQQRTTGSATPEPHPYTEPSRSGTPAVPPFPDGIKVLHDCADAAVDICFVHGLTGDRESTWTAPGHSVPWPSTLLPPRLRGARILTYGYDAYVMRRSVASMNRLIDHATNLLNHLTTDRALCGASSRPLIFVAHSLGGLVCKKAILRSRNNPEAHLRDLFECTRGIVFMGTPHRGSWMADWVGMPASALGLFKSVNKSLLEILETDSQLLEAIQVDFLAMIREQREGGRPLEVTCFFEELPLWKDRKVVSKESATFEGYNPISIHANHINMVKFASAGESGFTSVLGELVRWKSQIVPIYTAPRLSQDCLDCLKSLAIPQMESRFHDITAATTGTCDWLPQHDMYRRWAVCDKGLLWVKGKPGSGKSTLLKHALEHRGRNVGRDEIVLSFFFHGRGDELQKTPLGFFRSLLHQLLGRAPDSLLDLVETYKKKRREIGMSGNEWQWHKEELRRFLESSLPKVLRTRSIWLFVDALDECSEENAVDLFRWLKALLPSLPATSFQFRVFVTCRHYPILDVKCEFEVCPEKENKQDIATYVDAHLSGLPELAASPIPAFITDSASGVFMWARVVVDMALRLERRGRGLPAIWKEIRRVPMELDELYQELIGNMQWQRSGSLKLIKWVCFAIRPLSLDELRWAMVVDCGSLHKPLREFQSSEHWAPDNDKMWRQVQTLSCGLVEVTSSSDTQVVQFIHQSVEDFFLTKGLSILDESLASATAIGMVHFQLSRVCLRYLEMEEFSRPISYEDEEFPFQRYATTSWVPHMKECDAQGVAQDDILELLSWPSNELVDLWIRVYQTMDRVVWDYPREGDTLVHVLSQHGVLGPLSVVLLRENLTTKEVNAKNIVGQTPLSLAAAYGHEAVVRLLLETGKADINSRDSDGWTPLTVAALHGHEAVVRLLLETGKVDINSRNSYGWTPLTVAVMLGHESVIRLLLKTGKADINSRNPNGWTPLTVAASHAHEAVVRLLLKTAKADIYLRDFNDSRPPLCKAIRSGHEAIIRFLLDMGEADFDARDAQ